MANYPIIAVVCFITIVLFHSTSVTKLMQFVFHSFLGTDLIVQVFCYVFCPFPLRVLQ